MIKREHSGGGGERTWHGRKKAKKRTSTALLLVLIALAVFIGIELIQVNQRLGEAKVQEASLTRQMQQQEQENDALRSDLAKKDDPDFIKSWPATSWVWRRKASASSTM